jgi:hypothetical protein
MDLDKKTPAEAMGGHTPPAPRPPIPPGTVAYEKGDADPGSIVRVATALIVISVLAAVGAFGLFRALGSREARMDPPPPPLGRSDEGRLPPEPRLQTAPAGELAALVEDEQRALTGYGWVDEKAGVARIPIEEAMALLVGGMRPPAAATAATASGAPPSGMSPPPAPAPRHP